MSDTPADLKYTKEHEWARDEGGSKVRVGVTAYAVEQLGDVTLVDLPEVGAEVSAGQEFGAIESVKTASDLYAPISGKVVEVNGDLDDEPERVNDGTYEQGWMVVIEASNPSELEGLMDAEAYAAFIATLD